MQLIFGCPILHTHVCTDDMTDPYCTPASVWMAGLHCHVHLRPYWWCTSSLPHMRVCTEGVSPPPPLRMVWQICTSHPPLYCTPTPELMIWLIRTARLRPYGWRASTVMYTCVHTGGVPPPYCTSASVLKVCAPPPPPPPLRMVWQICTSHPPLYCTPTSALMIWLIRTARLRPYGWRASTVMYTCVRTGGVPPPYCTSASVLKVSPPPPPLTDGVTDLYFTPSSVLHTQVCPDDMTDPYCTPASVWMASLHCNVHLRPYWWCTSSLLHIRVCTEGVPPSPPPPYGWCDRSVLHTLLCTAHPRLYWWCAFPVLIVCLIHTVHLCPYWWCASSVLHILHRTTPSLCRMILQRNFVAVNTSMRQILLFWHSWDSYKLFETLFMDKSDIQQNFFSLTSQGSSIAFVRVKDASFSTLFHQKAIR